MIVQCGGNLRYIAHFDILGFRSAVFRDMDEAWGALSDLRRAMDQGDAREYQIAPTREYVARHVRTFIFSDTVVAFTASDQYQDLLAILVAAGELFKDGLAKCVPLRGAIAFGDFRYDLDLNLFAGPALIDAYQTGERAQWLGVAVTDEVASRYLAQVEPRLGIRTEAGELLLRRWDVPLYNGTSEARWVLNWPAIYYHNFTAGAAVTLEQWYAAFLRMFGPFDALPADARAKHHNTVAFVNDSRRVTAVVLAQGGGRSMNRWFHYRFRMVWPEQEPSPRFWVDILLLDKVVRDIVSSHRAEIPLWRAHRRAVRSDQSGKPDEAGHQFTLLLFTSERTADAIDQEIQSHGTIIGMRGNELLRDYFLEKEQGEDINQVSGTSDKAWSVEVQRAWPYYIMGVSEMLLDLVAHCRAAVPGPEFTEGSDRVAGFYGQLNQQLCAIWQQEGHHAFLHHMNALFGYTPLVIPANCVNAQLCSF